MRKLSCCFASNTVYTDKYTNTYNIHTKSEYKRIKRRIKGIILHQVVTAAATAAKRISFGVISIFSLFSRFSNVMSCIASLLSLLFVFNKSRTLKWFI